MSGGSYDYIYSRLSEECENRMYDAEMNDMIKDLCKVLHDLEWWHSGDSSEDKYRTTLTRFKAKWFKGNREERLKGYIDDQIGIVRKQLYALIGEPTVAESKHSTIEELEQEPDTWSLDDAREDFMSDVYNTLDFLPTNNECNKIIESFDRVTSGIKKEQKTGHWIIADKQNKEDVENDNYRFICSECQCSDIHAKGTIVPYCWKCGAKMVEPPESEDK